MTNPLAAASRVLHGRWGASLETHQVHLCIGSGDFFPWLGEWEPDEPRGSRPVLRGAGAATPRPTHPKLLGPAKWTYFYLYVILDVFSRYVVGWMVAHRESAELAKRLIAESCGKQRIQPGQLTLHADRGSSMSSTPVAFLLADLGVTKTHSRPRVSDDNPYSESQFRTLKYRPEFPDRFGCIQDSRGFSQGFFRWFNEEHRHSGLGLLTPAMVHYNQTARILEQRQAVLDAVYRVHPERFVRQAPKPAAVPTAVWINKPPKFK